MYLFPLADELRTLDWRSIGKMMRETEEVFV